VVGEPELRHYEQAVAWRQEMLPLLRGALGKLDAASDRCPASVEAVRLARAVKETRDLVKECERSLTVARKMVIRERQRLKRNL
jgi:hypothetical protein